MSQPHAGPNYGIHFPLHKDAEVLLTFVDGDPDRPIIAAAVPNPETTSPVGAANQTQSVIRTGGQNEIVIEDTEGGEKVTIQQACGNVLVLNGTKGHETMTMSQACGNVLVLDGTPGAEKSAMRDKYGNQLVLDSKPGDEHITIHSPHHDSGIELGRSNAQWTASNGVNRTAGNKLDVVAGTRGAVLLGSGLDVTIGNQLNAKLAQETSLTLGGRQSVELGYSYTFKRGASLNDCGSDNVSIATQDQILQAGDDVGLLGGAGSKGSVSAVLNLSGDQAMLSVGAKPGIPVPGTPPNVRPLIAGVVAASLAASVAAGHAVGKAGVAASATMTGILGLAELALTAAVLWKTRDAKVEPFKHASPTASVELTKRGGIVLTSVPAAGGIALDAQNSDIVLRWGAGKKVKIGEFTVRDGQIVARGSMTIVTASTAPRRQAPRRAR